MTDLVVIDDNVNTFTRTDVQSAKYEHNGENRGLKIQYGNGNTEFIVNGEIRAVHDDDLPDKFEDNE